MQKSILYGMTLFCSVMGLSFVSCSNDDIDSASVSKENNAESGVFTKKITVSVESGAVNKSRISVEFPGLNKPIYYKFQKGDIIMVYSPDLEQFANEHPEISYVADSVSAERYSRDYLTCESVEDIDGKQIATFSGTIRYTPNYSQHTTASYYLFAGGRFDGLQLNNGFSNDNNNVKFNPTVTLTSVYDEFGTNADEYLKKHYVVDGNKALTKLGDTKTFYEYGKLDINYDDAWDKVELPGNYKCTLNAITAFVGVGINQKFIDEIKTLQSEDLFGIEHSFNHAVEFYLQADGDNDDHDEGFAQQPAINLISGNPDIENTAFTHNDYYYNYGANGTEHKSESNKFIFTVEELQQMVNEGKNLILFPIYPGYYMDFELHTYALDDDLDYYPYGSAEDPVYSYDYYGNNSNANNGGRDVFYLKVAGNAAEAQANNNKPEISETPVSDVYSCNSLIWTGFPQVNK